jgi:hypothetical protein
MIVTWIDRFAKLFPQGTRAELTLHVALGPASAAGVGRLSAPGFPDRA